MTSYKIRTSWAELGFTFINPFHIGVFNKPKGWGGGRSAPPGYMAIGGYFHYFIQTGILSWM